MCALGTGLFCTDVDYCQVVYDSVELVNTSPSSTLIKLGSSLPEYGVKQFLRDRAGVLRRASSFLLAAEDSMRAGMTRVYELILPLGTRVFGPGRSCDLQGDLATRHQGTCKAHSACCCSVASEHPYFFS